MVCLEAEPVIILIMYECVYGKKKKEIEFI